MRAIYIERFHAMNLLDYYHAARCRAIREQKVSLTLQRDYNN